MALLANKKVELLADTVVSMAPHKKGEIVTISQIDFFRLNQMSKVKFIEDVPAEKPKTQAMTSEPKKKGKTNE